MSRLFADHYEFSIGGDDHYYRVDDIAPVSGNREHKHTDVEAGLDAYTSNWECVDTSTERRRGSDHLYLVDDAHYVQCSRTGLERAGNTIRLSDGAPVPLQWAVVSAVFEGVAQRKFGTIKAGVDRDDLFDTDAVSVTTPRNFILASECSQDELDAYYDDLADLVVDLLSRYHDVASVGGLDSLIDWWNDERTDLFREYAYEDWQPKLAYQVLTSMEPRNGWRFPQDPDDNSWSYHLLHESALDADTPMLSIELTEAGATTEGGEIQLVEDPPGDDQIVHEHATYETVDELASLLDSYMERTPADFTPPVAE